MTEQKPIGWCPYDEKNGYELSCARKKKESVERYIARCNRKAVAAPLYAEPIGGQS